MIHLTGLWKNKTKDGKTYLGGTLGRGRLLVFPNGHKEKDSDPDYALYLAEKRDREDGDSGEPEIEF